VDVDTRPSKAGRAEPVTNVRFGPFELDPQRREIWKNGRRIRLQEQPFQILQRLIESRGEVVTREEIKRHLWPDNCVVEFDHSINVAVKRLRDALRDSADKPRYIETVARRGYRFIGAVDSDGQPTPPVEPNSVLPGNGWPDPTAAPVPSRPLPDRSRSRILVLAAVVTMLVGVWTGASYHKPGARPSRSTLQPLVRLDVDVGSQGSPGSHRGADAILSPNGMRLVYASQSKLFTRQLDQASHRAAGNGKR
jgi:DNA-binding winged helix-turn-helix (wHTH) protein